MWDQPAEVTVNLQSKILILSVLANATKFLMRCFQVSIPFEIRSSVEFWHALFEKTIGFDPASNNLKVYVEGKLHLGFLSE